MVEVVIGTGSGCISQDNSIGVGGVNSHIVREGCWVDWVMCGCGCVSVGMWEVGKE